MHIRQKHCEFCGRFFTPDRRIGNKQRCCYRPECRKLRKAASQAAWSAKNDDYFKYRYENTKIWRAARPEYQRQRRKKIREIQDSIPGLTRMKSVRLLLPATWFKNEIQDTMALITVIDSDTYISTATGVRYKTRLVEAPPDGISCAYENDRIEQYRPSTRTNQTTQ